MGVATIAPPDQRGALSSRDPRRISPRRFHNSRGPRDRFTCTDVLYHRIPANAPECNGTVLTQSVRKGAPAPDAMLMQTSVVRRTLVTQLRRCRRAATSAQRRTHGNGVGFPAISDLGLAGRFGRAVCRNWSVVFPEQPFLNYSETEECSRHYLLLRATAFPHAKSTRGLLDPLTLLRKWLAFANFSGATLLVAAAGRVRPASAAELAANVDENRMIQADHDPANWMTYGRTYSEQRFSPLARITADNAKQLGLAWYADLDTNRGQEATPLVIDGVLYVSTAWSMVKAYDAKTGTLLWSYDPACRASSA